MQKTLTALIANPMYLKNRERADRLCYTIGMLPLSQTHLCSDRRRSRLKQPQNNFQVRVHNPAISPAKQFSHQAPFAMKLLSSRFGTPSNLTILIGSIFSLGLLSSPGLSAPISAPNLANRTASLHAPQSSRITFIDASTPDAQLLQQGIRSGTEVHLLDPNQDAIAQITRVLTGRKSITELHILSHGSSSSIDFASSHLDQTNLGKYTTDFQTWKQALTKDADILLYGCNIAQGSQGRNFVNTLSHLTGADVAASDNLTGSAKLGGDWILEYQTGKIEAPNVVRSWAQTAYAQTLALFTVNNTNDSGAGSLRQAILDANAAAGADEIVFRLSGSGVKTITLTSGQLEISDQLLISGLGRNQLTISGNNSSRVFQVNIGANLTLRGLTLENGKNDTGGAIVNFGKLDIRNSAFRNNSGRIGAAISNGGGAIGGGAITVSGTTLSLDNVQFSNNASDVYGAIESQGTATIRRCTFNNNISRSSSGGAIVNQPTGILRVERSTFTQNKAPGNGGGILNYGQLTVNDSSFISNEATFGNGGGIYNTGIYSKATAIVSYSSFQTNTAMNGGGIFNANSGDMTIEFSTLENNQAANRLGDNQTANGGGIFNASGTVRVKESQIRKNLATNASSDLNGAFISEGGNEIGIATGSTGFVNGVLGDRIGSN